MSENASGRRLMLRLACPAKINLFLEVVDKRPDGYHNIESIFCRIPMTDTLTAKAADAGRITMDCSDPALPVDGRNLVVKAAAALQAHCGITQGVHFHLEKAIPSGSGLGGGSSDAAAALRLVNTLWGANLPDDDLRRLAAGIGADVAFFLYGGICLCQGTGEIVTPLDCAMPPTVRLGLFLPPIHSDTAAAYRRLRLPDPQERRSAAPFIEAMRQDDADAVEREAFNRFEASVYAGIPALAHLRDELEKRVGKPVRLSGSGSGLWFLLRAGEAISPGAIRWAEGEGARLIAMPPVNLDRKT